MVTHNTKISIEVVSNYAYPWCYVGISREGLDRREHIIRMFGEERMKMIQEIA
ncbi:MAG: hypothetical protein V3T17_19750 [Pseudomonadales bacterium]